MPWLGSEDEHSCDQPIRAALRNATNVHFTTERSSIFIPRKLTTNSGAIDEALDTIEIKSRIATVKALDMGMTAEGLAENLMEKFGNILGGFQSEEIANGVADAWDVPRPFPEIGDAQEELVVNFESPWEESMHFRKDEFRTLSGEHTTDELITRPVDTSILRGGFAEIFDKITLVEKLRETRVMAGFTRITSQNSMTMDEQMALLRKDESKPGQKWLPAFEVWGEGIFLSLNEDRLIAWETQDAVVKRIAKLNDRFASVCLERGWPSRTVTPRQVMLHTLSHLIINRLNFECGYSSASLAERLYFDPSGSGMCGVLIYTASGDSEGTLGGLVRMGHPDRFTPLLTRALEESTWCSADPVCSEMGDVSGSGQGPESLNLAACHSCALLPETSCEEFNRFLDRLLVKDTFSGKNLGLFQ